jgi:hypothetical protein
LRRLLLRDHYLPLHPSRNLTTSATIPIAKPRYVNTDHRVIDQKRVDAEPICRFLRPIPLPGIEIIARSATGASAKLRCLRRERSSVPVDVIVGFQLREIALYLTVGTEPVSQLHACWSCARRWRALSQRGKSRFRELAINALLSESTIEDAAAKATISKRTLLRWLKEPEFREQYA